MSVLGIIAVHAGRVAGHLVGSEEIILDKDGHVVRLG